MQKLKCSVCFQPYCFKTRSIHFKSKKHRKVISIMDEYTKILIQILEHERSNPELTLPRSGTDFKEILTKTKWS